MVGKTITGICDKIIKQAHRKQILTTLKKKGLGDFDDAQNKDLIAMIEKVKHNKLPTEIASVGLAMSYDMN